MIAEVLLNLWEAVRTKCVARGRTGSQANWTVFTLDLDNAPRIMKTMEYVHILNMGVLTRLKTRT